VRCSSVAAADLEPGFTAQCAEREMVGRNIDAHSRAEPGQVYWRLKRCRLHSFGFDSLGSDDINFQRLNLAPLRRTQLPRDLPANSPK
jgi:hypothetical protein